MLKTPYANNPILVQRFLGLVPTKWTSSPVGICALYHKNPKCKDLIYKALSLVILWLDSRPRDKIPWGPANRIQVIDVRMVHALAYFFAIGIRCAHEFYSLDPVVKPRDDKGEV